MKRERLKTRLISLAVALLAAVMMVADLRANSLPISNHADDLSLRYARAAIAAQHC